MASTDRETILTNMHAAVGTLISGLEDWDVDKILAPRAEDCVQKVYPKTMEMAPMSNDAFRAFFEGGLKDTFWDVKVRQPLLLSRLVMQISTPLTNPR